MEFYKFDVECTNRSPLPRPAASRASRHPSSRRSGRSHGSPPPHAGRNNAGINQAARGVFAARPGRGPRRATAPEGKPSRLRWTEVTLPVLRPRSTPLGKLDPVIRLFEGNFLGRLSDLAQESRISRRLAWPRSRWLDTSLYRRPTARVQPVPPPVGRAAPKSPPKKIVSGQPRRGDRAVEERGRTRRKVGLSKGWVTRPQ
jgi:hypothetical protein